MRTIVVHRDGQRPVVTVTDRDPDDFSWPDDATVEVYDDEDDAQARLDELNAPHDRADTDAEQAWQDAIRDADSLADLKAVLVGDAGVGRVARHP